MVTIRGILTEAESILKNFASARLDAEVLLASTLEVERSHFYSHPEDPVPTDTARNFRLLLNRRLHGMPVAYLTGEKEFWSISLSVNQNTLIPRPETEFLVEIALSHIEESTNIRILDLGTGSGAVAIAIARQHPGCHLLAVDIDKNSLAVARKNVLKQRLENIELKHSDWFDGLDRTAFDLIVSNPPYVESGNEGFNNGEIRFEPRMALDGGADGMQAISSIVPSARYHLNRSACLILEHGHTQGEKTRNLLQLHGYTDIRTYRDHADLERISLGRLS